jgi:DNA-binding MarR family transcriptional regulator
VATEAAGAASAAPGQRADVLALARLGYLLKHAYLSYSGLSAAALAPYGIDGRELAALTLLRSSAPLSQQDVARRLGIDRTTMVALIDALEGKNLVVRRPDPKDRRRNIVELTPAGHETLTGATRAADDAERRFLESLGPSGAQAFKNALRTLLRTSSPSRQDTPDNS